LNIQNQQHEEIISQTITSDLEADLNSYKKIDENLDYYLNIPPNARNGGANAADPENEYLNGSTAGFGKKLREINREINEEYQNEEKSEKYSTINSQ
jgi:hypothetical protein